MGYKDRFCNEKADFGGHCPGRNERAYLAQGAIKAGDEHLVPVGGGCLGLVALAGTLAAAVIIRHMRSRS